MKIENIEGLSQLGEIYDGFVFDLWGVIHDGSRTFQGVIPALKKLREQGKKIIFLSNSPQRAIDNVVHLETLGIFPEMYTTIITSGEISYREFGSRFKTEWGNKYLCLGNSRYNSFLKDHGAELVFDEEDADFILNGGVLWNRQEIVTYIPLFERCIVKDIPMLCTNPDKIVYVGNSMIICAGTLAEKYEELGGRVQYFGKPHKEVYEECLKYMNSNKVLAVGDNMETDIKGAVQFGFDSLLITSGVHRDEFNEKLTEKFFSGYNYSPKYTAKEVCW